MTPARSRLLKTGAFVAFILAVILYATGAFRGGLVEPGRGAPLPGLPAPASTLRVVREEVAVYEESVGTVRSRLVAAVAPQVMARVVEITASVGQRVHRGDPLVVLDDREFATRLARAREAVAATDAARVQAEQSGARAAARRAQAFAAFERVKGFFEKGAATSEQLEAAQSEFLQAEASVAEAAGSVSLADAQREQARQSVAEAEIALGYTRIASPMDGVVVERLAEPGDIAAPGNPVLVLLDPDDLRLEARVREGLVARVGPGTRLPVILPAMGITVEGTVSEVVPSADPVSRTFEVRVPFDAVPGVHPGMFGRLRVPVGSRLVVRVPSAAVVRTGQMCTVLVQEDGNWGRRLVTTGADIEGGSVEILSGLDGGETVGLAR